MCKTEKCQNIKRFTQLVVLMKLRTNALSLAHASFMTGYQGNSRTVKKVLTKCYWPGVEAHVWRSYKLCDIRQLNTPKGRKNIVPFEEMPIIEVPFKRVYVGLVGPIQSVTKVIVTL